MTTFTLPTQESLFQTLRRLYPEKDQVVELFVTTNRGPLVGFYRTTDDGLQVMAADALEADRKGGNVYWGLNQRDPSWLTEQPQSDHQLGRGKRGTDKTTVRRQWLLLDVDPVRAEDHKKDSSSDEEKRAAKAVLRQIIGWLCKGRGWPSPAIVADSGNGFHALWTVSLEAEDNGLVHGCLEALAKRFDNGLATVDTTVGDPSRIARLYSTTNRKGTPTPDRPHRFSGILATNEAKAVPPAKLVELAAEATTAGRPHGNNQWGQSETPPVDRAALVQRARRWLAGEPPAISGEKGHDQTFKVACGLVVGFGLTCEEARPLLEEYNDRCDPPWSAKELDHKLEDAEKKAQEGADRVGWMLRSRKGLAKGDGESKDKGEGDKVPTGDLLLEIVQAQELWHTPDEHTPYATVVVGDHRENLPIESKAFQEWLAGTFLEAFGTTAKKTALEQAAFSAAALARHRGTAAKAYVRLAGHEEAIYLDLADESWRAVEITAEGWRVVAEPPVRFRRPKGMLALPMPVPGGKIAELQPFLNVASDQDFLLLVAWLIAALRPAGPYPVLCLHGEQGTAKSTTARLLRDLVDPYKARLRRLPTTDQDLMIAANNSWVAAFDNLSGLEPALSDALCCVATGGGYSTRKLYTNEEETIFDVCRPVILTGIEEVATRPDLLDRAIVVQLPVMDSRKRRPEKKLDALFAQARPRILGALLQGLVTGLANQSRVELGELPRMADFALWAAAAMPSFGWSAQEFREAYDANAWAATGVALDDNPVVPVLRRLLEDEDFAHGWPEVGQVRGLDELFSTLQHLANEVERKVPGWPKRSRDLAGVLRRLAPALRKNGIFVEIDERQTTGRRITPVRIGNGKPPPKPAR